MSAVFCSLISVVHYLLIVLLSFGGMLQEIVPVKGICLLQYTTFSVYSRAVRGSFPAPQENLVLISSKVVSNLVAATLHQFD